MRVREVCWRGVRTQACLCGSGCACTVGRATNLVLSDGVQTLVRPQVAPPLLLLTRPGYILSNPSSMPDDGSPGHFCVMAALATFLCCSEFLEWSSVFVRGGRGCGPGLVIRRTGYSLLQQVKRCTVPASSCGGACVPACARARARSPRSCAYASLSSVCLLPVCECVWVCPV